MIVVHKGTGDRDITFISTEMLYLQQRGPLRARGKKCQEREKGSRVRYTRSDFFTRHMYLCISFSVFELQL